MNDKDFSKITQELGDIMIAKNLSVTTAESCTGGWVSQEITAIPGSSKWFGFGLVTYSNKAKNQVLNVAKDTLKRRVPKLLFWDPLPPRFCVFCSFFHVSFC